MKETTVSKESSSNEDIEERLDTGDGPTEQEVEDNDQITGANINEETTKRYLPDHKKPDAAPTFPEKV